MCRFSGLKRTCTVLECLSPMLVSGPLRVTSGRADHGDEDDDLAAERGDPQRVWRSQDTKRGATKRGRSGRAPPRRGVRARVKYRSKCKVCSACPHGRRRSQCKECGGSQICEHGRLRSKCKCGGASFCEHGRQRSGCRVWWCIDCVHGRIRSNARSAVGLKSASTVVYALECQECGGSQTCEHGRQRSTCKECGGSEICEHGRKRSTCKVGGASDLATRLVSSMQGVRWGAQSASTVVALCVQSAARRPSASTVVCALSARVR